MLGAKIAKLRKSKGWTQKNLADATRLSQGYIASIEGGRMPGIRAIALIAMALGVEVGDLYNGKKREDG